MKQQRRVALVTGGAKRIGRAIALDLAAFGCDVAVHCHSSQREAEETAESIRRLDRRSVVLPADLTGPAEAAALAGRTVEALGSLNILVNNASMFETMKLDDFSLADWNKTLAVNLTAPMVLSHAAWPHLRADRNGRIVNLLDIAGDRPWANYLAYCVSKAGLSNLTTVLARAMAPDVHVNGVAPGAALSPKGANETDIKAIQRRIPALRLGTAGEVASVVRFMVSGATYMTGTILNVDGGRSVAF